MNLPDFEQCEPLNKLKEQMGIARGAYGAFPQPGQQTPPAPRAYILLKSGRRLDLLDPQPDAWTDEDLAIGLSRTYRWGGYSKWDLPLSVAQHSLAVLALREAEGPLTSREALRELLHDATESLFGGFDPIAPLRPHLGPQFEQLDRRLQAAVDQRYHLPPWTEDSYARHKHADRLAAASEALHVVGWSRAEMRDSLGIALEPLDEDPLDLPHDMKPWEPWPPKLAKTLFLHRLRQLLGAVEVDEALAELARAFSRLPAKTRARCGHWPSGSRLTDTLVHAEAGDGSQAVEGVIVDGHRDEDGGFDLDAEFTIFTIENDADGELIRCNGATCHVESL